MKMGVIEVSQENFDKTVLESDKPVLVDFNADWCGPCKMFKPVLEKIAQNDSDHLFVSVNIDNEPELSEKYEILSIPCLVIFKNGEEVTRSVGAKTEDEIIAMFNKE